MNATKKKKMSAAREPGRKNGGSLLEHLASRATQWVGGRWAFVLACGAVIVWAATGPIFHYSDTWQLIINTGTTVVTFLMVFLIQRSQNNDSRAIQLKLNELVAALDGASNRLIGAESLSEAELEVLSSHYKTLVTRAMQDAVITESHSVDEAERRHRDKRQAQPKSRRES
jgi:low affinity Fe/Cu permease